MGLEDGPLGEPGPAKLARTREGITESGEEQAGRWEGSAQEGEAAPQAWGTAVTPAATPLLGGC